MSTIEQVPQKFLKIPFLKWQGLVCVNSISSASSSWFVSTPCGPCFLVLASHLNDLERDVTSMCQNLLVFLKDGCLLSTTSML
jgi:hypothetical protein